MMILQVIRMRDWLRNKHHIRAIGRVCGWGTMALVLLTLLTGYGITQFRIVGPLTFGLLTKAAAQRWHAYTDLPLVVFLAVHVGIALWWRISASKPKE
jgi:thiosulfate reductase cytochrome b subunit